ncbi:MAG: hypothetical protein JXA96_11585 [Sedimentisphaerales bacterium]|nr:hypothetical protein [Sedimentisphaerales bacterium]
MAKRCFYCIVLFLVFLFVTSTPLRAITSDELARICKAMESSYQDITVEYEWLVEPAPSIEDLKKEGMGQFLITVGPEKMKWSSKLPFDKRSLSESIATYMNENEHTFQEIIMESYDGKVAKRFSKGAITSTGEQVDIISDMITERKDFIVPLSTTPLCFSVLHLKYQYENLENTPLSELLQKKEFVRIVEPNNKVNGFNVIYAEFLWDAPNIPLLHKKQVCKSVYFSIDHGYTPIKYEDFNPSESGPKLIHSINITSLEKVSDNLWFPISGSLNMTDHNLTNKYKASKITVNQGLTDDYFNIKFPPGTRIDNEITGMRYVQPEYEVLSLVGKSIPVLTDFRIELKTENIENKRILVCFFDYEQRPSRNCILELNKKEKELNGNNIILVAINTSGADKSILNEWIEESKIAFPVGKIESDLEKTKASWGVQSLPWLILADKEHIVKEEGFGISQLDEKIKL